MPPITPPSRPWTLTDRTGESRTFVQAELTIDGEVQLFSLLNRMVGRLSEAGFPFASIGDAFPDTSVDPTAPMVDWPKAATLISMALPLVPEAASEAAAVLMGLFPTDEYGKPVPEWTEHVAFMRRTIKAADLIEMLQTFAEQNDVERLIAPFVPAIQGYLSNTPRIAVPSGKP